MLDQRDKVLEITNDAGLAQPKIVLGLEPDVMARFMTPALLDRLRAVGTVVDAPRHRFDDWSPLQDHLQDADIILTGWGSPILHDVIDRLDSLKAVVHTGGTIKTHVPHELLQRGVRVASQTAENAEPVAEYTVAMAMLAAKDTFRAARLYARRRAQVNWMEDFPEVGFYGSRIGIIGLSKISRRVIELLKPFNVEVLVYSRHLSANDAAELGVIPASIEDCMTCDVVSLHSADTPANRHMINRDLLRRIRPGATFINTARGGLVDQDALIEELRDGRFDAILDVADPDVTEPDSPLWDLDNVLLTPHFAGSVGRELQRLGEGAVINVEQFLRGEPMSGEITAADYDKMA